MPHAGKALALVGAMALGCITAGCSGGARESGAAGTSGEARSEISVRTTPSAVTIGNQLRVPLQNVEIAITAVGVQSAFSTTVPRIEPGEAREVPLDLFRTAEGATFNRMFVRPRDLVVKAHDQNGKRYETSVRWQQ